GLATPPDERRVDSVAFRWPRRSDGWKRANLVEAAKARPRRQWRDARHGRWSAASGRRDERYECADQCELAPVRRVSTGHGHRAMVPRDDASLRSVSRFGARSFDR